MVKNYLETKDRDGYGIKLVPDVINLLGIGWDIFEKGKDATFPTLFDETFSEIKEIEPKAFLNEFGINKVLEVRRFELKIPGFFDGTDEDPERVLQASYFKNEKGNWVFRVDAYEELYKGTPAEAWIDW